METSSTPSFVTAVLATAAGRLDKDGLNTKLGQLARRIEEVKVEVYDSLRKKYAEFYPLFDSTTQLQSRVSDLHTDIDAAIAVIEKQIKAQLSVTSSDYDSLQQRCCECRATLKLLEQLVQVVDGLNSVQKLTASQSYIEATRIHASVHDILADINRAHGRDVAVFKCLVSKHTALTEKLQTCVVGRWMEMVTWSGFPSILTLASGPDAHQELQQLSQSAHNLGCLSSLVAKCAGQVMSQFVDKLLLDTEPFVFDIKQDASSVSLSVKVVTTLVQSGVARTLQQLEMFTLLMETLYHNLLNITVTDEVAAVGVKSSGDVKSSWSLMSAFGEECSSACLERLISHCLSAAVPSSRSELPQFSHVTAAVEDLQTKLVAYSFISEDNKVMMDYVKNVDVLFTNKRCVELLDEARRLIKSNMHNIVQVSDDVTKQLTSISMAPGSVSSKKHKAAAAEVADVKLDPLFIFPQCHISVTAEKLVDLAVDVLREAVTTYHTDVTHSGDSTGRSEVKIENGENVGDGSSDRSLCGRQMSVQLFYTARNMFEMFASLVPVCHRQMLSTLPQMAAVHHNDCMYIAHHLMLLGHQLKPHLPLSTVTFIDLVPVLRRSGTHCFIDQMSVQRTQLIQCLNTAHGFVAVGSDDSYESAQRALSQVVLQLRHLVNVWRNILPAHVYAKALGTLTNSAVSEVVSKILMLEDIREDDAHSLETLLAVFSDDVRREVVSPVSLVHELPLAKLVPSWARLQETRFLLHARLHEIADRWTDGPLAAEMSAAEVKHMIRAVFENNDRRSATLNAIK